MKLFQIEEPDGSPSDPDAPGAAIGIDAGGAAAQVAVAVGGNAALLADREGFALDLSVPAGNAARDWQDLYEGARLRAERALARPVTHAVVALAAPPDAALAESLARAAAAAGIGLLSIVTTGELDPAEPPACAAAVIAEELAPRPEAG